MAETKAKRGDAGMMPPAAVEVVLAWHAALNRRDVGLLLALSAAEVEVGGPRGTSRGADQLRDWVTRAGITLAPGRIFCRQGSTRADEAAVVVEQAARWPGEGGSSDEPQTVATAFRVVDSRIAAIVRHVDLATALSAAGLAESDQLLLVSGDT